MFIKTHSNNNYYYYSTKKICSLLRVNHSLLTCPGIHMFYSISIRILTWISTLMYTPTLCLQTVYKDIQ